MVIYFESNVVQPPVTLFMGADKYENEDLIKWGWPEDVWFHVDKFSSAHVYLRLRAEQTIDDIPATIIDDAAQLVKANSIEGSKMHAVDVVYTMWSNLKKTQGMEVGQVGFYKEKEVRKVHVARNNAIINRLIKTKKVETPDLRAQREERDRIEREDKKQLLREQKAHEKREEKRKQEEAEMRNYTSLFTQNKMTTNVDTNYDSDDFM